MSVIHPHIPPIGQTPAASKSQVTAKAESANLPELSSLNSQIDSLLKALPQNEKKAAVLFFNAEKNLRHLINAATTETKKQLNPLLAKLSSCISSGSTKKAFSLTKDKQTREREFLKLMKSTTPQDAIKLDKMLHDVHTPRRFAVILSKELVLGMYSENTDEKCQAKEKCELLLKGLVTNSEMRKKLYHSMPDLEPIIGEYLFFHSPASSEMRRLAEITTLIDKAQTVDAAVALFKEALEHNNLAKEKLGKGQSSSWADDQIRALYEQIEDKTLSVIDTLVKDKHGITAKVDSYRRLANKLTRTDEPEKLGTLLEQFDALGKEIIDAYPKHPLLTTKLIQRSGLDPCLVKIRTGAKNKLALHPDTVEATNLARVTLLEQVSALKTLSKQDLTEELGKQNRLDTVLTSLKVPQIIRDASITNVFLDPRIEEIFACTRAEDFEKLTSTYPPQELLAILRTQAYSYLVQLSGPHFVMGDTGEAISKLLNALSDSAWMKQRGIDQGSQESIQGDVKMLKEVFDDLSIRPKKKSSSELSSDFLKTAGEMFFYLDPEKVKALKEPLLQLPFDATGKAAISQQLGVVIAKMEELHNTNLSLVTGQAKTALMEQMTTETNSQKRQALYSKAFQEGATLEEVASFCASKLTNDFLVSIKTLAELIGTHSKGAAFSQAHAKGSLMLRAQELLNIVSKGFGMTAYEMLRNCSQQEPRLELLKLKATAKEVNIPFNALLSVS